MRSHLSLALCAAAVALLVTHLPDSARAEGPYPLVYSQRPITLTEGLFQVDANFIGIIPQHTDFMLNLAVDVEYGVTEDFTIGVNLLSMGLIPDPSYGNPRAHGRYRFTEGSFELGAELGLLLPLNGGHFGVDVGLIGRLFLSRSMFLNIGAVFTANFSEGTPLGFRIPIELAISLWRQFYLQIHTGVNIPDLRGDVEIPVGFGLGYTIKKTDATPLADISLSAYLPYAITTGNLSANDIFVMLGARIFF